MERNIFPDISYDLFCLFLISNFLPSSADIGVRKGMCALRNLCSWWKAYTKLSPSLLSLPSLKLLDHISKCIGMYFYFAPPIWRPTPRGVLLDLYSHWMDLRVHYNKFRQFYKIVAKAFSWKRGVLSTTLFFYGSIQYATRQKVLSCILCCHYVLDMSLSLSGILGSIYIPPKTFWIMMKLA